MRVYCMCTTWVCVCVHKWRTPPYPVMVWVVVVVLLLLPSDQREDGLHQVEVVDPPQHHQDLVDVVQVLLFVVCVASMRMAVQTQELATQTHREKRLNVGRKDFEMQWSHYLITRCAVDSHAQVFVTIR